MINKVTLIGNLGRDPEIRHFEGGSMVTKFSIATNENYRDKNGEWQTNTEWHEVVCWGYLAERVDKSLNKGNLAFVEGKLTTRKWQDKEGNDRYTTEVVANIVKTLERRESGSAGIPDTGFPSVDDRFATAPQKQVSSAPEQPSAANPTAPVPPVVDDLPF